MAFRGLSDTSDPPVRKLKQFGSNILGPNRLGSEVSGYHFEMEMAGYENWYFCIQCNSLLARKLHTNKRTLLKRRKSNVTLKALASVTDYS